MKGYIQRILPGLAIVLVIYLAIYLVISRRPQVMARPLQTPEPQDIAALRATDKIAPLPQCVLPEVTATADRIVAAGPEFSLTVPLGTGWRRTAMDTDSSGFNQPSATFENGLEQRIRIRRVANGSSGRSFLADANTDPLPADECEVTTDTAGSIWSFYPGTQSADAKQRFRFIGLADVVTSRHQRLHITVAAWSKAERDSLAAIMSTAVLEQ